MSDAPQSKPDAGARSCLAIILAAGEGTRMRSARPKVLHHVAGRSMLAHVLAAVRGAGASRIVVVIGPGRDDVADAARAADGSVEIVVQTERLGTAHAVLAARDALAVGLDDVVVAYADTPLVTTGTFDRLRRPLGEGSAVVALGFAARDPTGYGRFVVVDGALAAIREERDASEDERRIGLVNAGLMAMSGAHALELLQAVGNANARGEYYLTDVVEAARARRLRIAYVTAPETEVLGVNDRGQLAVAEAAVQETLRASAMTSGTTLVAPSTVFLSADTRFGQDVVVEPNVVFGPGVTIGDRATIKAFSHLEGAWVGDGSVVGPFARLRPGAVLGPDVHVGNFVEIKNSDLAAGVKANHLAYIGDASVGRAVNVGAGTITCNYDGSAKHRTTIGDRAFIGTNASLVAPVTIGEGAYVGSGSVITEAVPPDALALGRGRQVVKEGWAKGRVRGADRKP